MTTSDEALTVMFPARSGYLRISRLNATTYGAKLGFDVDALDDLRLAVDEAVTWLLDDEEAGGTVTLQLSESEGGIRLVGERNGAVLPEREVDDLVHAILGATLDSYELVGTNGGGRRVELLKGRPEQ
jgi:anti-sigma regulatory factor (Ser/Thr protein kinase)